MTPVTEGWDLGSETENESRRVSPWLTEENKTHWVTDNTESCKVNVVSE